MAAGQIGQNVENAVIATLRLHLEPESWPVTFFATFGQNQALNLNWLSVTRFAKPYFSSFKPGF